MDEHEIAKEQNEEKIAKDEKDKEKKAEDKMTQNQNAKDEKEKIELSEIEQKEDDQEESEQDKIGKDENAQEPAKKIESSKKKMAVSNEEKKRLEIKNESERLKANGFVMVSLIGGGRIIRHKLQDGHAYSDIIAAIGTKLQFEQVDEEKTRYEVDGKRYNLLTDDDVEIIRFEAVRKYVDIYAVEWNPEKEPDQSNIIEEKRQLEDTQNGSGGAARHTSSVSPVFVNKASAEITDSYLNRSAMINSYRPEMAIGGNEQQSGFSLGPHQYVERNEQIKADDITANANRVRLREAQQIKSNLNADADPWAHRGDSAPPALTDHVSRRQYVAKQPHNSHSVSPAFRRLHGRSKHLRKQSPMEWSQQPSSRSNRVRMDDSTFASREINQVQKRPIYKRALQSLEKITFSGGKNESIHKFMSAFNFHANVNEINFKDRYKIMLNKEVITDEAHKIIKMHLPVIDPCHWVFGQTKDVLLEEMNLSYHDLVANTWVVLRDNFGTEHKVHELENKLRDYKQTHVQSTRDYMSKWNQIRIEYKEEMEMRNVVCRDVS